MLRNFAFLHNGEEAQPEVEAGDRKSLNLRSDLKSKILSHLAAFSSIHTGHRFNRHSTQDSNSNTRAYISPLRNQNDQVGRLVEHLSNLIL